MAAPIERVHPVPSRRARREFSLDRIRQLQRARMIHALVELLELGEGPQPSVGQIVGRARASRKTFYEHFDNRGACLLAAYDETVDRATTSAIAAYGDQPTWRAGVRAGLECILLQLDQEPGRTRLCVVDSLRVGEPLQRSHHEVMRQLAVAIDLGRGEAPSARELPATTAEAIVGGAHSIIHGRLVRGERGRLVDLLNPLMSMIVLPYLGPRAAREEQDKPHSKAPKGRQPRLRLDEDALSNVAMRLTYRTVRVLVAIARSPGASNRQIALDAGVSDQGQMSKLLVRLVRLGLIENLGGGQAKGMPNAWWLTAKGAQMEQATRLGLS